MEKNNINVEMKDIIADPKNQEELIQLGGIDQVPMLLIDGKPLYESSDIIQWFKDNM
jgi:glutaredoxin